MRGRLAAIRYRPWQSLVLVCLSAVVAGSTILAPLYDRALQQALASNLMDQATPDVVSVSVRSAGVVNSGGAYAPYETSELTALFPASAQPYFEKPLTTLATSVIALEHGKPVPANPLHAHPVGELLTRDGMCSHIEFAAGSCPTVVNQIAISTEDAKVYGWSVGDKIDAMESSSLLDSAQAYIGTLEVVGVYTTDPDQAYWVARPPTGKAGLFSGDGLSQHDGWLAASDTLGGSAVSPPDLGERWGGWALPRRTVDLLLDRDKVGVDELFSISGPLDHYLGEPVHSATYPPRASATAYSGIPALAARAKAGRDQAHQLVPLFVIQLALLAGLTLWLVLGAAVEQRRPEVAVVRLRGGDAGTCRRLLVGELGPPILLGWLLGLLLAAGALLVIGRHWLDPDLDLEVSPLVIWTALVVLVVELLMLLASTWSAVTATAPDLLRRVRPRTGWALSFGPAIVVLMCGAAFAATAAGSLSGWVATAAPTLLAISVGLVLGFLLGPAAGRAGSGLLGRGRLVGGLGLLQLGRRHGMRTAIATMVAAAALLAFAVNALSVGERNRSELAKATVGAPTVLRVEGRDLAGVRAAAHELDPSRGSATVAVIASAAGGMTTMAVVPDEYSRVAAFTDTDAAAKVADALRASALEPLELQGNQLALRARWTTNPPEGAPPDSDLPLDLDVVVVRPEHAAVAVTLDPTGTDGTSVIWGTDELPCDGGCWLTGITVNNRTDADLDGSMTVRSLTVDGVRIPLGGPEDWTDGTTNDNGFARPKAANGVAFNFFAGRGVDARLAHRSVPDRLAAVTSGRLPPDSEDNDFTSVGLDGVNRDMEQVGTEPYLPGAPADAALVDLDVLERDGTHLDLATRLMVYLDSSISAREASAVLRDHGISVSAVTSIDDVESGYAHTAPAWALQLGVVAAAAAALLAALVLAISFLTSWRLRSADSLALRLNGVGQRRTTVVALLETVPLVLLSVASGLACGVIGSRIALPDLPFFDTSPPLPVQDLHTSWASVILAGSGLLGALTLLAVITSMRLGRRSLSHAAEAP